MSAQAARFQDLLRQVLASNPFYRRKLLAAGVEPAAPPGLEALASLPLTTKSELVADQAEFPPFGSNLTYPLGRYTRLHQTSGTTAAPLRWLDTAESWSWWLDCWQEVYRAAGVTAADRVFFAFSFGPFIGFWTAFESAQRMGAMALAGGGLASEQRLETLLAIGATVVVCTPTYALRLGEVAVAQGIDLAASSVRVTIHAGEPGASIPAVRDRLEAVWGARAVDHAGATEMGAWGFGCGAPGRVHVNDQEFLWEVLDPQTGDAVAPDESGRLCGELVLSNLGRIGSPLLRYRSGDLVRLVTGPCGCGRCSPWLEGGVLGRADAMLVVRGINVFPSALEQIVRELPEIGEFEVRVVEERSMHELLLRIEVPDADGASVARALGERIHRRLNLRPRVELAPVGTLPRYELKARRFRL